MMRSAHRWGDADKLDTLLRCCDVAPIEYDVLMTIGYEILVPYQELAGRAMGEGQRPRETISLVDYDRAVEICLVNGWLKILTAEDCERDSQLWATVPYPKCSFAAYQPGLVDFTPAGAQLHQQLTTQLHALHHVRPSAACFNTDTSGRIEIYSTTHRLCREQRQAIQQNPDHYTGEKVKIIQSSAIRPIGPWWMSRWQLMLRGYHASVSYHLLATDLGHLL